MNKLIPILAGPTASGKTGISVALAQRNDAEIISADSRQIFKGFQIGTASPGKQELDSVKHHFIQEFDTSEHYSAGVFANLVSDRIDEIHSRDKQVIVVGGSTLYVQSLLQPFAVIPQISPDVRTHLNERLAAEGASILYEELTSVDPAFAATLDPTKSQRIVRGLEVFIGTGEPLSSFFDSSPSPPRHFRLFILNRERDNLYSRINDRVDAMIEEGLVDEVKGLLEEGPETRNILERTIGYQELIPFLEKGEPLANCVEMIKRNSRRYAKRQLTWYKRFEDAVWLDVESMSTAELIDTIQGQATG